MREEDFYAVPNIEELAAGINGEVFALSSLNAQPAHQAKPRLNAEALYGLAGEIVRAIEPYTESDAVATLSNVLVAFGNVIRPTPYARVEHTKHHLNIFVALVGETAKGRKGTSWSHRGACSATLMANGVRAG